MNETVIVGNPRHDRLLHLVKDRGYVSVEELTGLLDVSAQTIRRDIKKLSDQRLLIRHHGGAARASSVVNLDYAVRQTSETAEKEAIAKAIVEEIPDNSSVFLTIGTTTEILARHLLRRKGLEVITNSLRVAHLLYHRDDFKLMIPGGQVRSGNGGVAGAAALDFVKQFRVDYLITTCGAIDADGVMLDFDYHEVLMVQAMMATARTVFVAADSTKFSATATVEVGPISKATAFFTDKAPSAEIRTQLQQNDVTLVVV